MGRKLNVKRQTLRNLKNVRNFDLTKMCTPATIYFVISLIGLILVGVNNLDTNDTLCVGNYNCYVGNNTTVFILNAIYILFWTFILDLMCKAGYSSLSWFVLLLPFIILFILFAIMMVREGATGGEDKKGKDKKDDKKGKDKKDDKKGKDKKGKDKKDNIEIPEPVKLPPLIRDPPPLIRDPRLIRDPPMRDPDPILDEKKQLWEEMAKDGRDPYGNPINKIPGVRYY